MKTNITATLNNCSGGRSIGMNSRGNRYTADGTTLRGCTPGHLCCIGEN